MAIVANSPEVGLDQLHGLGLLGLVRVLGTDEDLEAGHHALAEVVAGKLSKDNARLLKRMKYDYTGSKKRMKSSDSLPQDTAVKEELP